MRRAFHQESPCRALYEALENGIVKDSDTFRQRLGAAEREKEENLRLQGQSARHVARPLDTLTLRKVDAITRGLGDLLRTGNVPLRKAYLGLSSTASTCQTTTCESAGLKLP